jgi:hypothetical protein
MNADHFVMIKPRQQHDRVAADHRGQFHHFGLGGSDKGIMQSQLPVKLDDGRAQHITPRRIGNDQL